MSTATDARARWGDRLVDHPAELAARYRRAGEWTDAPLVRRFQQTVAAHGGRLAVTTAEGSLTYDELDGRTDRIAAGLVDLGLSPGDPVLFQVTNRLGTVLAWYGCLKAGLVPVATLAAHRAHEIDHISRAVGAVGHVVEAGMSFDLVGFARDTARDHPTLRHVLTVGDADGATTSIETLGLDIPSAQARRIVDDIADRVDPLDVCAFQLSGGTTGVPKVIPRLHVEYWDNAVLYARRLGWSEQTRVAHLIPIIHNAGITCGLHAAHAVGARLVLATSDVTQAFPLMVRTEATDVLIGHGHYQAAAGELFDGPLRHLRTVVLSGAKVRPELFSRIDCPGERWAGQLFGMSEGLFLVTPREASAAARQSTVGTPIAQEDEIRILEPGSEDAVPAGGVGELCCRGPYTIPGYFDAVDHNARAFTRDGFYRTGDLARVTTIDGLDCVSIEGRIKDVINRGGEKVNAEELELLLARHPAIVTAAVVAMPDPRLGERACAYLVAHGAPVSMDDVQGHLESLGVAKFKWPERLEWVSDLPTTAVGKVDKKSLRADIASKLAT